MISSSAPIAQDDGSAMLLPPNESERLRAVRQLGLLDTPREERFDRFTRLVTQIFHAPIALIALVDAERVWFKSAYGVEVQELRRDQSFCTITVQMDGVVVIASPEQDARFSNFPFVAGPPYVRFYAGAPLHSPGGHVVGTLCLIDTAPRTFTADDQALLAELAAVVQLELRAETLNQTLAQLHSNREALTRQTETVRAVLDATEEAMLVFAPNGTLVDTNQRTADLFGVAISDYLGRSHTELAPLMERVFTDPVAVMARWDDMLASTDGRFTDALEQKWPEHRLLALDSAPLRGAQERTWGRLFALRDVTAQRQVDRLRYEFMEALSASLRGPLTTVKGYVDLLLEVGFDPLTATQREMLSVVKQNADGMVAIIEELIDVALLSAVPSQMQKTYVDLRALVESILRNQLSNNRTALAADLSPDLPRVYGDPDALTQIVRTAFKGSLRLAQGDTPVQITATEADDYLLLHIQGLRSHEGNLLPSEEPGGAPPDLAQLELAMARSILRQQGGDVVVNNRADGGVILTLRLPKGPA